MAIRANTGGPSSHDGLPISEFFGRETADSIYGTVITKWGKNAHEGLE